MWLSNRGEIYTHSLSIYHITSNSVVTPSFLKFTFQRIAIFFCSFQVISLGQLIKPYPEARYSEPYHFTAMKSCFFKHTIYIDGHKRKRCITCLRSLETGLELHLYYLNVESNQSKVSQLSFLICKKGIDIPILCRVLVQH